ncbi:MAG: hypothetical protein RBT71_09395 [Flavobacteriales bacterium]|jgi:hypothetical protein|nr:hypothetical protein [Flavobacteriales bacterium]
MRPFRTLLLVAGIAPTLTKAQEWDLFPLDQRSHYLHDTDDGPAVSVHLMDSVRPTPQGDVLYFRWKLGIPGSGDCMEEILASEITYWNMDPNPVDSLVARNDTVFYHHPEVAAPFYFLPGAAVGQGWTITSAHPGNGYDQITITCAGIDEEEFWGITDSVKTFTMEANGTLAGQTPVSDFQFRLSKHHGLLELVPFRSFLIHPASSDFFAMPLIGLERDGEAHGFRQPKFHDYFHLSVGDILVWRRDYDPGWAEDPGWTRYYRDSITSVSITADTVRYTLDRITEMETGELVYSSGQERIFSHERYGAAVENATYWYAVEIMGPGFVENLVWNNGPMLLSEHPVNLDTVVSMSFQSSEFVLLTELCEWGWIMNYYDSYEINTIAGVVEQCTHVNPSLDCQYLIAWRIDGVTYNDISLGIGSMRQGPVALEVFPNPASDRLELNGAMAPAPYRIIDARGAVVMAGTWTGGPIEVAGLRAGLYLVHVGAERPVRFMKQ